MKDLNSRIKKLEQAVTPGERVLVIKQRVGETNEGSEARWLGEHPGEVIRSNDLVVLIADFSTVEAQGLEA